MQLILFSMLIYHTVAAENRYTRQELHKLKRKVDKYLLPLMWLCYGIQQTDKTCIGAQAIFGLRDDMHLVGQQYSWLTTIFYMYRACSRGVTTATNLIQYLYVLRVSFQYLPTALQNGQDTVLLYDLLGYYCAGSWLCSELHSAYNSTCVTRVI